MDTSEAAQRVLEGTNAFRKAQDLPAVSAQPALEAAARDFARYMAKSGNYGHAADGRQPSERAAAHGYDYCIVSENIAYQYRSEGYDSAEQLAGKFVEDWKASPEHRRNMTDPAVTQTGVGIGRDDRGRYFAVQMFGRPTSAAIRFEVRNRSGDKLEYRAGERRFSLPPRVSRTHMVCRPVELSISRRDAASGFSARARDGARYTVTEQRVLQEP